MNEFISNIKEKVGTHKTLIQNFSYLSALQVFNMLVPLLTYPYLIRVLGKETYGLVVFAQAIIGYLVILVNFGFNISSTKEVSIHRNNKDKLNEIVSSTLIIKSVLFCVSIAILAILILVIPQMKESRMLFLLTMWMCLYEVIFPIWYFQGIERMKYITYLTLVSRLIFIGLIFVIIHNPSDYLFVPIINGIGALCAGIISLFIVFKTHSLEFRFQPYVILKKYFKDSIPIFLSNVSVRLYVGTNKVIVGAFLGMAEVSYYDLAEKVIAALKIPHGVLGQALFPKISKERNLHFIKRIFNLSLLLNLILFVVIIVSSKLIVQLLGGQEMLDAKTVLNILLITVPIVGMSNIFGIQMLIPFGYSKSFSRVIVSSGLIYMIQALIVWGTIGFSIISVALITVVTEIFVTTYMFYYCRKYKLWI